MLYETINCHETSTSKFLAYIEGKSSAVKAQMDTNVANFRIIQAPKLRQKLADLEEKMIWAKRDMLNSLKSFREERNMLKRIDSEQRQENKHLSKALKKDVSDINNRV